MESRRTTIVIEKELYRQAKRVAVEQDKTLKQVMEDALRAFLRGDHQGKRKSRSGRFGIYPAKTRGSLRREALYKDFLR